jgi:hypothetical protein
MSSFVAKGGDETGVYTVSDPLYSILGMLVPTIAGDHAYAADKRQHDRVASKVAVGKTQAEIRKLFGSPDHVQDFSGQIYWYYTDPLDKSQIWQLVFTNGVVSEQNLG